MKLSRYLLIFWLCATLIACGRVQSTPTFTPAASTPTAQALTPAPTFTPLQPTVTSTPLMPLVILLRPPEAESSLADRVESALRESVRAAGLRWQVRPALEVADLSADLRLVIALPPASNVAELANAAAGVQFLALGLPLEQAANVTVLRLGNERPDMTGFMAGMIAAMITQDTRIGMLSLKDDAPSKAASNALRKGITYYCGLCQPLYPPFYEYPYIIELPAGASAEWQAAADFLIGHQVETVFVFAGAGDEATLTKLAEADVTLLGMTVPPEALQSQWAASLRADPLPLIESLTMELLTGDAQPVVATPLAITDVNPLLLSQGRYHLAEEVLNDLLSGFTATGVDPQTGEYLTK